MSTTVSTPRGLDEPVGVPGGRLRWSRHGADLLAGDYRIRLLGPGSWETTLRGRVMRVDGRRSTALAAAEHHYREMLRVRRIVVWGVLALVAMVTAAAAGH